MIDCHSAVSCTAPTVKPQWKGMGKRDQYSHMYRTGSEKLIGKHYSKEQKCVPWFPVTKSKTQWWVGSFLLFKIIIIPKNFTKKIIMESLILHVWRKSGNSPCCKTICNKCILCFLWSIAFIAIHFFTFFFFNVLRYSRYGSN